MNKRLEELMVEFRNKLNKLSFKELATLLNKTKEVEFRGIIVDVMEKNHEEEFINWIG